MITKKITLSYSTINNCLQPENSHNWLNKQMGMKVPDNIYFEGGRRTEKIITAHISGKLIREDLAHIKTRCSIVAEVEFDPRCKRFMSINDKYQLFALLDAHEPTTKTLVDVKSGNGKMWSVGQWARSYQRKLYALAYPEYDRSVVITALMDDTRWKLEPPKEFNVPSTPKDKEEALEYLHKAIKTIEAGDFTGGLTDGKCLNSFCYYKENCQFK